MLVRPSLTTDQISLGFWLNISFVVNYQGAFRSIVAIAIDLLTSEDRYFLWITAVPLPRRCLHSWQKFGIAHARCNTRIERATKFATRVGSSLLDSFTVPSTHYLRKIVCTFSLICRACTNSIAIYLIIMRYFMFLCIGPHQQSAISSSVGCDSWAVTAGSGTSLVIAQWLEHSTCSRKYVA